MVPEAARVAPQYPIYIPSKGRADTRLTVRALDKMAVPYRVVVQPQSWDEYTAVIDATRLLVLPFNDDRQGLLRARNWRWEHAISEGHARHWQIDDNVRAFYRYRGGKCIPAPDGSWFAEVEAFACRYTNLGIVGPQYGQWCHGGEKGPFILNTRVYSCYLLKNDMPHRFRVRYNDDTDLCLQALKGGWCTALLNAYVMNKSGTMTLKGGNTDELYRQDGTFDGRLEMAKSLVAQHSDVTKITRKWGRWQHQVDYRPFKGNKLKFTPEYLASREHGTTATAD